MLEPAPNEVDNGGHQWNGGGSLEGQIKSDVGDHTYSCIGYVGGLVKSMGD